MKKIIIIFSFIVANHLSNGQTWNTLSPQPDGLVGKIFSDTINNVMYIGGQFTTIGALQVNHIAKWDGSVWDSIGSGFNERVQSMAIYNGELYAGGWFTMSGSINLSYIAKWNGITWEPVGTGFNNAVLSLTVFNGELYAGGAFTQSGSNITNHIARWNGTTWSTVNSGINNWVYSLAIYNNELYTGGTFTVAGGVPANYIAKWNGTIWSAVGSGLNNSVSSMIEYNGFLHVGGNFTSAGGASANCIAKWDGIQWDSLGIGLNNGVTALSVYNTELYAAGLFTASGPTPLHKIGRWNGFGWNTVGTFATPANISSLSTYAGNLFVGGSILLSNPANWIVKWNTPPPFPPTANFYVNDSIIEPGSFVKFTNQSIGSSVTFNWSFPGGSPSTSLAANPIVNYSTTGSYDVTLVVSSSAGVDSITKTSFIIVSNAVNPINSGVSTDYFQFEYTNTFHVTLSSVTTEVDTSVFGLLEIYYYKPANYNPLTSPILWGIHGVGGNGNSEIVDLQSIADRRNALVVSVSMINNWAYSYIESLSPIINNSYFFAHFTWYQTVFKQIYQHLLKRENRPDAPVFMIGFSSGGQFVTRYMLVRQGIQDSIPIKMAVSTNPYSYTFCADTASRDTFVNVPMHYPYGLLGQIFGLITTEPFHCNEHIMQYYNENYGVLIGTADTLPDAPGNTPLDLQGRNHYERAQNFYAFSDSDATVRGTSLQWPYVEIPGVGHYQPYMYNVKQNVTDSSTIAETLLFDTPYHNVPSLAPVAGFNTDTTIININGTVNFTNNSINATNYLWDFGDGTSSTLMNPSHVYSLADTFTVSLVASTLSACENKTVKRHYIIVKNPTSVNEINLNDLKIKIYPNPAADKIFLNVNSQSTKNLTFVLYNTLGIEQKRFLFSKSTQINIQDITNGIYIYKISKDNSAIGVGKIIKQ